MEYLREIFLFVQSNDELIIAVVGVIGTAVSLYLARARGQALDAVVDGVATSGNKAVMTIIKEQFHSELYGLARYILSERANKAKQRQIIIKKLKGES